VGLKTEEQIFATPLMKTGCLLYLLFCEAERKARESILIEEPKIFILRELKFSGTPLIKILQSPKVSFNPKQASRREESGRELTGNCFEGNGY